MRDLLDPAVAAIKTRSRRLLRELERLGPDIELWLSYLSQQQPWLTQPEALYRQSIFAQLSSVIADSILKGQNEALGSSSPPWLISLVRRWHEEQANVLTLNYDTLIEKALWEAEQLPGHISYQIPVPYVRTRDGTPFPGGAADTLRLFKLHGSISWYYLGPAARDETVYRADFRSDWGPDQATAIRASVGGLVPLVVPPVLTKDSYFTNDRLREQWYVAGQCVKDARRLFLIGYSLPATDHMMRFFLSTASKVTTVVLVNRSESIAESARAAFPNRRIDDRFVGRGDVIPEFVNSYREGSFD